jgi:hypothetical protein
MKVWGVPREHATFRTVLCGMVLEHATFRTVLSGMVLEPEFRLPTDT